MKDVELNPDHKMSIREMDEIVDKLRERKSKEDTAGKNENRILTDSTNKGNRGNRKRKQVSGTDPAFTKPNLVSFYDSFFQEFPKHKSWTAKQVKIRTLQKLVSTYPLI